jgi:hypothetical protein
MCGSPHRWPPACSVDQHCEQAAEYPNGQPCKLFRRHVKPPWAAFSLDQAPSNFSSPRGHPDGNADVSRRSSNVGRRLWVDEGGPRYRCYFWGHRLMPQCARGSGNRML